MMYATLNEVYGNNFGPTSKENSNGKKKKKKQPPLETKEMKQNYYLQMI